MYYVYLSLNIRLFLINSHTLRKLVNLLSIIKVMFNKINLKGN